MKVAWLSNKDDFVSYFAWLDGQYEDVMFYRTNSIE